MSMKNNSENGTFQIKSLFSEMFFRLLKARYSFRRAENMDGVTKNEDFHRRLALLIGTEEPFRWSKRMGIPSATFARIWNNYDIPKHDHLCRIARRCNVSLDWLLLGRADSLATDEKLDLIPLVGLANCGIAQGWYNEQTLTGGILLPSFVAEENAFAVLCRGLSMRPAGIEDGNVCLVYPNRPVETGKPALIRTKAFVKGREVSLATIKVFDSEDGDAVMLSGWLDPDETGNQALFTEKRLKNCITQIAPVGNVLPVKIPENTGLPSAGIDKGVLAECLNALRPLYPQTESSTFAEAILFLYEQIRKNNRPDMETLQKMMEIIGGKS